MWLSQKSNVAKRSLGLLVMVLLVSSLSPAPTAGSDLDWVPADAAGFVRLLPADLLNPLLQEHGAVLNRVKPETQRLFEKNFGLTLPEVKRLTLVFPNIETVKTLFPSGQPAGTSAVLIVTTVKPFDRAKLFQGTVIGGRTKTIQGKAYAFNEALWSALYPINDTTFLFGAEEAVLGLVQQKERKQGRGPLTESLELAAGKSQVVIGLNATVLPPEVAQAVPPPLQPLFQAESVLLAVDLGQTITVNARLAFPKEIQAAEGAQALRAGLAMARQFLAIQGKKLEKELDSKDFGDAIVMLYGLGFLRLYDDFLKDFPLEQKRANLEISIKPEGFPSGIIISSLAAITMLGQNATTTFESVGSVIGGDPPPPANILQIGKALESYHEAKGNYPPPAILAKNGEPLLSWRVALLPYLGEEDLYKQFKLDEPWDSFHNRKLLMRMPKVFAPPFGRNAWKTSYQVFVGPGSVFEGPKGCRKADITDGLATTILLVRVHENEAIAWTKPGDLAFALNRPMPRLTGRYGVQFDALFADGSARSFNKDFPEQRLRALITRNGGEKVTLPEK